jgi:hypothetical protein
MAEVSRGFPTWPAAFIAMRRAPLESVMQKLIDRVMKTFGMMKPLSEKEAEQTREVLLDFLSKRPGTDDHQATAHGLTFLRNLKT